MPSTSDAIYCFSLLIYLSLSLFFLLKDFNRLIITEDSKRNFVWTLTYDKIFCFSIIINQLFSTYFKKYFNCEYLFFSFIIGNIKRVGLDASSTNQQSIYSCQCSILLAGSGRIKIDRMSVVNKKQKNKIGPMSQIVSGSWELSKFSNNVSFSE